MRSSSGLVLVLLLIAGAVGALFVFGGDPGEAPIGVVDANDSDSSEADAETGSIGEGGADGEDEPEDGDRALVAATTADMDDEGEHGFVVGTLLEPGDAPVEGARVFVVEDRGWFNLSQLMDPGAEPKDLEKAKRARSGADGTFRVAAPTSERPLRLICVGDRHLAMMHEVAATSGGDSDVGVLRLEVGFPVIGSVVGPDGRPVEDALVEPDRRGSDPFSFSMERRGVKTNVDGEFRVLLQREGEFRLVAYHDEFASQAVSGSVSERGREVRGVRIQLATGARVTGVVRGLPEGDEKFEVRASKVVAAGEQAESNDSMAAFRLQFGARLSMAPHHTEVGEDGTFSLGGLEIGAEYRVAALPVKGSRWNKSTVTPTKVVASGASGVSLEYRPGVAVTFQAVDEVTGKSIGAVTATARLTGGRQDMFGGSPRVREKDLEPDDTGVFRVPGLQPSERGDQRLKVTVEAAGYRSVVRSDLSLPKSGNVDLGILRFEPLPMIAVTVRDDQGQPLVGATVRTRVVTDSQESLEYTLAVGRLASARASARGGRDKTDDEGKAEIAIEPGQAFTVRVTHKEYATYRSEPLKAPDRGRMEHEVDMIVGGTILAKVVDPRGEPLPNVNVERRETEKGGSSKDVKTDAKGIARFAHVAPGEYRVRILSNSSSDFGGWADVEVEIDETAFQQSEDGKVVEVVDRQDVELVLEREFRSRVTGIVRQNGKPLVGATISIRSAKDSAEEDIMVNEMVMRGGGRGEKTDSVGRFEIQDVKLGDARLLISHESRAMPSSVEFRAVEGETVCDVDLRVTVLSGRVVDHEGKPVSGASLSVAPAKDGGNDFADMRIYGWPGSETQVGPRTQADGTFRLEGVQPDTALVVTVKSKSHRTAKSDPVSVALGSERRDLQFVLEPAGKIVVEVKDASVTFAYVSAVLQVAEGQERKQKGQMLQNGKTTLSSLDPGTWKVTVHLGEEKRTGEVTVAPGETATLSL